MKIIHTLLLMLILSAASAQSAGLKGSVSAEAGPVAFASIALEGTTYGVYSEEDGSFELRDIPPGVYTAVVSSVGYRSFRKEVELQADMITELEEVLLQEDVFGLEEVVVTGTMKETFVANSPVKVEVLTAKYLDKNIAPTNLTETVSLINGVEEVVACGVCYTNSISINGLEGAYTAVLMDGSPIYGNLAAVYGLNGIPTMIIDRIEVIKGPNSTLYGSEAVAGVINIITKDPAKQALFGAEFQGTSQGELYGNAAFAPKFKKSKGYIGVDFAHGTPWQDQNNDGFGDVINIDRISVFSKWTTANEGLKIAGKYYYEDRRNGVFEFLQGDNHRDLRGDDQIYGESILTERAELFGSYQMPFAESVKVDFSLSRHLQDSYYGSDAYTAEQNIVFANFIWNKRLGKHDLTAGISTRFQDYDDNTVATQKTVNSQTVNNPDRQFIPGVFVQDEWEISERWSLLPGARLDNYQAHGVIFAPRFAAKFKPGTWSTFRANFGTGFRIVNLFTEDHAFVTGQREIIIAEELRPEQSYNASLNYNHILNIGNSSGSIDLTANYTYFTNKIIPDYDNPGQIVYANSEGHAETAGFSINYNQQFTFPLAFNIGLNFQRVTQTEFNEESEAETTPIEFAPDFSGTFSLNYTWRKPGLIVALTGNTTGPMQLPETFDLDETGQPLPFSRPLRSETFSVFNLQVTKDFKNKNFSLFGGVQNIFNYIQPQSPLTGFNDPNAAPGFSEYFDTAYAFGQLHGREVYLGVRWNTRK